MTLANSFSAFRHNTQRASTPIKKMWHTQDERKLLLFMQLFQQWLQVAAVTLHLEELEEQRRRRKEERRRRDARRRTRRQRTQWVRLLALVSRFDPFRGMVEVVWLHEQQKRNDARSAILCSRSVLSPYCLRRHPYSLRHVCTLYALPTAYAHISVLSPYCICTV